MKKRDNQLNMTHNELMEVKLKSLRKLEDPNLTEDEAQEIENLINLIDKAIVRIAKKYRRYESGVDKNGFVYISQLEAICR